MVLDEASVNRWLLKAYQKYNIKLFDDSTITVTEAVFPCLRYSYYKRTRKQLPTPAEALKALGNEVHTLIQDSLRDEGWETEVGIGIELNGFKLVGRADAVRYDGNGNALEVIELKSSNGLHTSPLEAHKLQLQTYLTILHARVGYLIYIDRASGRVKVFRVKPDRHALREVIQRAKQLHEALVNHQPPPPTRGPWCNVCPYKLACFSRRW
jgi:CRISPR-associated protein Cas4